MRLLIVIVDYRTPELARKAVETANDARGEGELVVLVDTSEDRSLRTTGWASKPHTLIHAGPVGYAGGINAALARIHTDPEFVLITNADVEFPDKADLNRLIRHAGKHPTVGVIGPRQVTPDGRIAHAGIPQLGDSTGGRWYGQPDYGQGLDTFEHMPQVSGSVMLLRLEALTAIGGAFPSPAHLYFEDAELCRRLREEGWLTAYDGSVTFIHHVAGSPEPPAGRARLAHEAAAAFRTHPSTSTGGVYVFTTNG